MINTKKMITLGVLAVTGLGLMGTTTVHAAMTGGGETTVSYTPGQSTGGDGSSVANWTVDYPKATYLNDKTVDENSGSSLNFKLYKTVTDGTGPANEVYDGTSQVKLQLGNHTDADSSGNIKLKKNGQDGALTNVTMGISYNKSKVSANASNPADIVTLNVTGASGSAQTSEKEATVKAYLTNRTGATEKTPYTTSLTWIFTGNEGTPG